MHYSCHFLRLALPTARQARENSPPVLFRARDVAPSRGLKSGDA